jgi:hypothetical protein
MQQPDIAQTKLSNLGFHGEALAEITLADIFAKLQAVNVSLGSPEAERPDGVLPRHILESEPEPEPEPEREPELEIWPEPESDARLAEAENGGRAGAGAMLRMDYPAGFASTARRPGMAPGMDAYLAAGQLAVSGQQRGQANNGARDGGGDVVPSLSTQQMTGGINKSPPLPSGAEVKAHMQASQQDPLRETQSDQTVHLEPFMQAKPNDPHHVLGVKKALFRAVVQDNASLVSNLVAQHPELLT